MIGDEIIGYVHSFEPLGSFDGPGLRTVVFLSGCPMRCKYCHNPDMLAFGGGNRMSVGEVVERIKRDRAYTSGVTVSGGEPLCQGEFLRALLRRLKRGRVHTALDTAGSIYDEEALSLASLVILDIKHTDSKKFGSLCSYEQSNALKTLEYLRRQGKPFWIRQVIVPNITDDEGNILALARMSAGAEKVELLPYHTMGIAKWEKLGIEYPLKGVREPSAESMARLNAILHEERRRMGAE